MQRTKNLNETGWIDETFRHTGMMVFVCVHNFYRNENWRTVTTTMAQQKTENKKQQQQRNQFVHALAFFSSSVVLDTERWYVRIVSVGICSHHHVNSLQLIYIVVFRTGFFRSVPQLSIYRYTACLCAFNLHSQ